jgi:LacI family transcriptional regulator
MTGHAVDDAEPEISPTGQGKRATLEDVAQLAGVSVTTVSRALNGRGRIGAETRRHVQAVARGLNFTPNPLAQGLLAGKTGTVGLITNDLEGRFSLPVLMGVEDALASGSASVFLCDSRGDPAREQMHLRALLSRRVDGLIVVADNARVRRSLGRDLPVPVVYAHGESDDPADMSVTVDNVQAGRIGIEFLLARGRRRIAYIGGDIALKGAAERAGGARSALAAAGLAFCGEPLFGPWNESWGRQATDIVLNRGVLPDAVLCGSDHIARGVLDVLHDRGKAIPGDVAVLGHDNLKILAADSRPTLSSIDMRLQDLGRRAAELLLDAMKGSIAAGVHRLPCAVVERQSTGARSGER